MPPLDQHVPRPGWVVLSSNYAIFHDGRVSGWLEIDGDGPAESFDLAAYVPDLRARCQLLPGRKPEFTPGGWKWHFVGRLGQ